jgi:GT2 family glycosyltransferase
MPVKHFHPGFLREAIHSMLRQTSEEWRLIVVVDETPQGDARAVIDAAATGDGRVAVLESEGRALSGAINTGMRRATTAFTGILHGDDLWAPNAVEVLTRAIERWPEVDFFHSARAYVGASGRLISSVYAPRETSSLADFAEGAGPVKHLLCWRREAGLAIGGLDETLNSVGPDDFDFPWRMAEAGCRFQALPECLYLYRDHREGYRLTTHLPRTTHVRELRRMLRNHGVSRRQAKRIVAAARSAYLKQCLYRSGVDRWLKERRGYDAQQGWHEPLR